MRNFARFAILASLATATAAPALAQNIPPGQSCGGLFCDLGILGHKVPVAPDGTPITTASAEPGAVAVPAYARGPAAAAVASAAAPDPHRLPCHDFLCHAFGQPYADAAASPAPEPVAAVEPVEPAKPMHKAKRKHVAKVAAAAAPAAPAAPAQ